MTLTTSSCCGRGLSLGAAEATENMARGRAKIASENRCIGTPPRCEGMDQDDSGRGAGPQARSLGNADAQLGPLGYRVMLECKTGARDVTDPDAVKASKYRDAYHAQYCALIGPGFAENTELGSELQTHGVSAWSVADLQRQLAIGSNPHEMLALFAPGFVGDVIDTLLWNRLHGERKRGGRRKLQPPSRGRRRMRRG